MTVQIDTTAVNNGVRFSNQGSNPSAPASGYILGFTKSDGLYVENSTGTVTGPLIAAAGGGVIDIFPWMYNSFSGSWSFSLQASQMLGGYWNAAVVGDYLEFKVEMAAGTYTYRVLSPKNTDGGQYSVAIDGTTVGTIDLYNGSLVWNQLTDITGIVVASSGLHAVRFTITGKNGSSSSFNAYTAMHSLWRTA